MSLKSDDDFPIILTDVHVPLFDNVLSPSNIMGIPLPGKTLLGCALTPFYSGAVSHPTSTDFSSLCWLLLGSAPLSANISPSSASKGVAFFGEIS